MRAIRGEASDQAELYIAYPSRDDGTWILVTGRPLRDESGGLQGGVVVFHDITRRKKAERRLAAQYETTRVLAEAETPAQANAKILETICERLDWDYGAFWRVDVHAQRLRCAALWHQPNVSAPGFMALTRSLDYQRGDGAPGPCLGQRPARLDSPRSAATPILLAGRPPRRTVCNQHSRCRSSCGAIVWAFSSSSATKPGLPTSRSWK